MLKLRKNSLLRFEIYTLKNLPFNFFNEYNAVINFHELYNKVKNVKHFCILSLGKANLKSFLLGCERYLLSEFSICEKSIRSNFYSLMYLSN